MSLVVTKSFASCLMVLCLSAPMSAIPRELCGTYRAGSPSYAHTILLHEDGRFDYEFWSDIYQVHSRGRAKVEGDLLVLTDERGRGHKPRESAPERAHFVKWGRRQYLVPESEMITFASEVRHGKEAPKLRDYGKRRHRDYYLRLGDEDIEAEGKPTLPGVFPNWLLEKAPAGTISDTFGTRYGVVTLGTKEGLRDGSWLGVVTRDRKKVEKCKVLSACETRSLVDLGEYGALEKGLTVTTYLDAIEIVYVFPEDD